MSMTDPIADFLTRIRNATMRKHAQVEIPASNVKIEIAKVLKQEGFIEDWLTFDSEQGLPRIVVNLKYDEGGESVLRGIKRISRPGLRWQAGYRDLTPVLSGQGVAIVSTSKGVLADYQCREQKVGGEVLCQVW
jgi:small subunit ribosomal protein S8